jgi:hypothetical protein
VTDDPAALGAAAARLLADAGRFPIRPGLTGPELDAVETEFGFPFADDHRAFLAAGLPTGRGWPDWRDGDRDGLRDRLAWPVEGVLFDVVQNAFWYGGWGPRPEADDDAVAVARGLMLTAPRMVPIHAHHYLPGGRGQSGHPVLSIYRTDAACNGTDLLDFLSAEFGLGERSGKSGHPTVEFWSRLI